MRSTDDTRSDGRATRAQLQSLQSIVLAALIERVKAGAGPETLAVSRGLLQDNAQALPLVPTRRTQEALRKLFTLHTDALVAALEVPEPSAAVLAEVRAYLRMNGITKDAGAGDRRTLSAAVQQLGGLPFQ